MLQANGYYRAGLGYASANLERQIPLIVPGFPEIRDFYRGTINVRFEPKIIVAGYDHRTQPIRWADGEEQAEVFDLVRAKLLFPALGTEVQALMYVAHWSPLRNDPHMHEFVAGRFIEGLQQNMVVVMECPRSFIELPYTSGYVSCVPLGSRPRRARTLVIL